MNGTNIEETNVTEETVTTESDVTTADFLISIFMSALHSYRHDTVLRPFPPFFALGDNIKDIDSLRRCADSIPRVPDLHAASIDDTCASLIQWITEPRTFHIRTMTEPQISQLREQLEDSAQWCSPAWVLEVVPSETAERRFQQIRQDRDVFLAYHGSRIENFHSILHNGLASHMNKNGLFGEGTYLSTAISLCLHYSPTGQGWTHSTLGDTLSCVAVCQVIDDASVKCHTKDISRSRIADSEGGTIPQKYYIATNNEMVRVRYLLVYTKRPTIPSRTHFTPGFIRRHRFLCLMVLYALILIAIGLSSSKSFTNNLHKIYDKLFTFW